MELFLVFLLDLVHHPQHLLVFCVRDDFGFVAVFLLELLDVEFKAAEQVDDLTTLPGS